jgi:hypothetical protein
MPPSLPTQVGYELKVEGEITQQLVAQLDSSIDVARVTFQQVRSQRPLVVVGRGWEQQGYVCAASV